MVGIYERKIPRTRGVVFDRSASIYFKIRQFLPRVADDVPWLEHIWAVEWSLPAGYQHMQRTVPFPVFNLVIDKNNENALHGCSSFFHEYLLEGSGHVVGFRLRPAAQTLFYTQNASTLMDGFLPAIDILSEAAINELAKLNEPDLCERNIANSIVLLAQETSSIPPLAYRAAQMVQYIENENEVFRVSDLVPIFGQSERSIQRQFEKYIGLSPKLVIDRFRIHNALHLLKSNGSVDFAELALRLGYYDQSHFSNAFKRMVGFSPEKYSTKIVTRVLSE